MSDYTTINLEKGQTVLFALGKNHVLLGSTFDWEIRRPGMTPTIKQASLAFLRDGNELELSPPSTMPPHLPTTIYCPNGVILSHQLEMAQNEVNKGFNVVFTAERKRVFQPKAAPEETSPNLTLNAQDCVTKATNYEKLYYQLRTAIRQATQRHADYKLPDTAIIAEDLRTSNNLPQATDSFERLLQEIIDQTKQQAEKSCKAKLDAKAQMSDRTEKRLRDKISQAISILSGEGYYSGGLLSPRTEENRPHIIKWYPHKPTKRY